MKDSISKILIFQKFHWFLKVMVCTHSNRLLHSNAFRYPGQPKIPFLFDCKSSFTYLVLNDNHKKIWSDLMVKFMSKLSRSSIVKVKVTYTWNSQDILWHVHYRPVHFIFRARACLHQVSASTLQQLSDDTSDSVLIENNGVTTEWGCNPFSSDSIVFNQNRIGSVIVELSQRWCWRSV